MRPAVKQTPRTIAFNTLRGEAKYAILKCYYDFLMYELRIMTKEDVRCLRNILLLLQSMFRPKLFSPEPLKDD